MTDWPKHRRRDEGEFEPQPPDPPTWPDPPVPPEPPPPPAPPAPSVTPLRIQGVQYMDDAGPVLPIYCHYGDAFSRYVRDPDTVRRQLDEIKQVGYRGIRFWTVLGGSYWAGRDVDAWASRSQFAAFGQELAQRGLQCVLSQGDMWAQGDPEKTAQAIREFFPVRVIEFSDAGNETWQNGQSDPARLRAWVESMPGIRSLTSPPGETRDELAQYAGDIYDVHGFRGGHWHDKLRHIFNVGYENAPWPLGIQSEPFGPGHRVSVTQHQHELTAPVMQAAAILSLMTGQAWVYFCGPGVMSDEGARFSDMPGFAETPQVLKWLPPDLMAFRRYAHGGSSQDARIFAVTDEPGTTRCDHAIHEDGRFVCLIYGPNPQYRQRRAGIEINVDVQLAPWIRLVVGS